MTQPVVEFTYEDYGAASAERGGLSIVPAPNLKHRKVCFKEQTSTTISWSGVAREEHGRLNKPGAADRTFALKSPK